MRARPIRTLAAVLGTAMLVTCIAPGAMLATSGHVESNDATSVVADIATGQTVQYTRFYPRKDDYRDTNTISGTTLEPSTVTIRIYTSGGTRIKSFLLGTKDGPYSANWNGRKKDNSLFPQGTYTVKQFVTDAMSNTQTASHTVVLSHKRLYWHIGSQTRNADSGAFFTAGNGLVSSYTSRAHGVSLFGGTVADGYAAGRYVFTLPSAQVYASLRVSIYGSGNVNGDGHETHGQGYVGYRNFETGELDAIKQVGYVWAWYEQSVIGDDHVTVDHKVQAWAQADQVDDALLHYTKVKLTYKYGLLDY